MDERRPAGESPRRPAPLAMSADEFREVGHALVDEIAAFFEELPALPVNRDEGPVELRALLPAGGVPESGQDAGSLFAETLPLLRDHSLFNGHPRFFGYITSSPAPIGALADLLAAALNPNLGGWQLSPIASEIEAQCVDWIGELLGFPVGDGLLVSGGNVANLSCFLAARRARAPEEIRRRGLSAADGRLLVYASTETHTWIQKAADLFGHGTDCIRWIPVDGEQRIRLGALREQIEQDRAAGDRPFLIVGTGGSVSTGAVDPLTDLAAIARENDLWFHVDGAYGAFGVLSPDAPEQLRGLSVADSVAVDPHKWLYAPLEAGCALVRHPAALVDAFSYTPPYYRFDGEEEVPRVNYYERGFQNSRGFRALKVWLAIRQVGRAGYVEMISEDIRLTRELFAAVGATAELEAHTCELSIATFRFVPERLAPGTRAVDSYLDRLNERLLAALKSSGEVYLSNAVVDGKFLLRACIVNFRTSRHDVEALPEIVVRHGRKIDRGMRGES